MKIHAIQTGTVQTKTNQRCGKGKGKLRQLNMMLDNAWTQPLPIYAWAIEHPEGVIVVDTGETSRSVLPGYFPRWHPYFLFGVRTEVLPQQEIGSQLLARGIRPTDVRTVILTHLHTDHAGGLSHFPASRALVSQTELNIARGFAGKLRGYLPHRWPDWFDPETISFHPSEYGSFEQCHTLTKRGDVVIVPTPGHTPGHVSVIVLDEGLSYFLAGDTSYSQELLLRMKVDGVSPDEEMARLTMAKILKYAMEFPTVYLPTHDPDSRRRLENKLLLLSPAMQSTVEMEFGFRAHRQLSSVAE